MRNCVYGCFLECYDEIALPDYHQAHNDVRRLFARNDECCVRNEAPFRHCEFLFFSSLRVSFFLVIASFFLSVIARSEATKQSPLTLHPVIANRRVGECAGVKQSPRCTFLLVLGVLGGIASPDCYQARNDDTLRKSVTSSCSSFYKNSLLTRCNAFIPDGFKLVEKKIIKKIFCI